MHVVLFMLCCVSACTNMLTHVVLHIDGPYRTSWIWADDELHILWTLVALVMLKV